MARPLWITSLLTLWTASLGLAQAPHGPAKNNYVVSESQGTTTWAARSGPETLPPPNAYPGGPNAGAVPWTGGMAESPTADTTPYPAAGPAGPGYGGCATCGAGAHRQCDLHSLCAW